MTLISGNPGFNLLSVSLCSQDADTIRGFFVGAFEQCKCDECPSYDDMLII